MLSGTGELSGKYAAALFELAREEDNLSRVKDDMTLIDGLFAEDTRLKEFLGNPFVDGAARKACIMEIFQKEVQTLSLNFLLVLVEKKLEQLLPFINKAFQSLVYEAQGVVEVKVTTARELLPDEYGKVSRRMTALLKKPVTLDKHVDKNLLGGIVVQIGDRLIDGSARQRLREFERLLKSLSDGAEGAVGAP